MTAYYAQDYLDLETLAEIWPELGPDVLILGRGSNILFQDGIRELSIVVWEKNDHPIVIKEVEDKVVALVDAGMSLPGLLRWCAGHGFSGTERMAGIPGSVGGAIAMNAGSYGVEAGDILSSVTVWTPESGIMELETDGLNFGYRTFKITSAPGPFIVLKACFIFEKDDPWAVRSRIKEFYNRKKSAQPILENTAGCVFKNPDGFDPAGFLLEQAGFRGKTKGGVCFSDKHANFLVNKGNGSSQAALELITEAREAVLKIFGASLELEVRVV